jgi:hypothetical protein
MVCAIEYAMTVVDSFALDRRAIFVERQEARRALSAAVRIQRNPETSRSCA